MIPSAGLLRLNRAAPRQFDILQSGPWLAGDRMQFDQLKRREHDVQREMMRAGGISEDAGVDTGRL
jgi:hypothetical protein